MGVRGLVGLLLVVLCPGFCEAADCVAIRHGDVAISRTAACDGLRLLSRRSGARLATWIEFVEPASAAEWRYNEWIHRQLAARRADAFAVESLYRSDRLISARYSFGGSVNVDAARWTLFSPDDVVSLGAAANTCWGWFAGDKMRGPEFARAFPRERPWIDGDFGHRPFGPVMREIIGPDVIDPEPSAGRTRRLFVAVLRDQARWSFSDAGARVDFGALLGKASQPFSCSFAIADLTAIARPGAAVPP
jgi:hypothetical protein